MVIGRRFAWSHLPKTGGTATLAMFEVFPDLVEHADPRDSETQHATFRDRRDEVAGKLLSLGLRRLPSWVLSRAQYVARFGLAPDFEPGPMRSPHELAADTLPDERLKAFTAGVRIDRWLRMEHLAQDLLAFIGELRDVSPGERERVEQLGSLNGIDYDHEVEHWFTPDQVRVMYERESPMGSTRAGDLRRTGVGSH